MTDQTQEQAVDAGAKIKVRYFADGKESYFTKENYEDKTFKCKPYFPNRSITRRKEKGNLSPI